MDIALESIDGVVATDQHGDTELTVVVMNFGERLQSAYQHAKSALLIGIAPRLDQLPLPMQHYDDPFLPYGRAIIDATSEATCGYVFHLGAYLALGAAGAIALERTLAAVPTSHLKILHAPFITADYVRASYEDAFNADAVTLATSDATVIVAYTQQPTHGVFIHAATDADVAKLTTLAAVSKTQMGSYQTIGETYSTLKLLDDTSPTLHWRWGNPIFASRGDDFRDVMHTAALEFRQSLL